MDEPAVGEWTQDEYGTWFLTIGEARVVWIGPRTAWCDRGRWYAGCDRGRFYLDGADAFPRYYMNLERAKAEMHDWLVHRLSCEAVKKRG